MARFPGFIGGSGIAQSLIADAEDTINLYVERLPSDARSPVAALLPTPGFTQWSQAGVTDVGTRGGIFANGRLFIIIGGGLYEFDVNGTPTRRATVAVDGNPAQIIFNGLVGAQLGIASGGNIYSYTLATNTLNGPHLTVGFSHLGYSGGFGLAFQSTTGKVNLSNLNDLTTWAAGTFFQRSLFADPYQAMFIDANNLVWMLGTDTFEVRYNTGVGLQPFSPLSGLVGRYGIAAPFAFALSAAGNFWLARNPEGIGQFVVTRGSIPVPVSNYALNTAVAGYLRTSKIDDAEVFAYQQEGHTFPILAFPSAPATWAYDADGQNWAKRGAWNPTLGRFDLWGPRVHVYAFGKSLVGDRTTAKIWDMNTTVTTDIDGTGIVRERTAPGLIDEHKRVPIDQFEILMDVGLGTVSGLGSNPQAMLRVSVDGGRTYGNERIAAVGRMGEYRRRVSWSRLGAPAHAVLKVRFSDPAPTRVVDAWLNNVEPAA